MITQWYVAAADVEDWRTVSNIFGEWLDKNASLQSFGYSEGDAVTHQETKMLCFKFPSHHGEKIELFSIWAATTGRTFGGAQDGVVKLNNSESFILPSEPSRPIPEWLK
jgi:hypothetical protein